MKDGKKTSTSASKSKSALVSTNAIHRSNTSVYTTTTSSKSRRSWPIKTLTSAQYNDLASSMQVVIGHTYKNHSIENSCKNKRNSQDTYVPKNLLTYNTLFIIILTSGNNASLHVWSAIDSIFFYLSAERNGSIDPIERTWLIWGSIATATVYFEVFSTITEDIQHVTFSHIHNESSIIFMWYCRYDYWRSRYELCWNGNSLVLSAINTRLQKIIISWWKLARFPSWKKPQKYVSIRWGSATFRPLKGYQGHGICTNSLVSPAFFCFGWCGQLAHGFTVARTHPVSCLTPFFLMYPWGRVQKSKVIHSPHPHPTCLSPCWVLRWMVWTLTAMELLVDVMEVLVVVEVLVVHVVLIQVVTL